MRFLALLFLLPSVCFAGDWSKEDTYRQTALTVLLVADFGQTRWIAKHAFSDRPGSYTGFTEPPSTISVESHYETSPLLGRHPSIGKVNNYFMAAIIGHAAISNVLPRGWRNGWQYFWIGAEANQVNHNRRIGIKMDF